MKISMKIPQKTKNRTLSDPAVPILHKYPKELSQHTGVYCSTIHNSQAMESAQVPYGR
jgi:hypothetical protein